MDERGEVEGGKEDQQVTQADEVIDKNQNEGEQQGATQGHLRPCGQREAGPANPRVRWIFQIRVQIFDVQRAEAGAESAAILQPFQ